MARTHTPRITDLIRFIPRSFPGPMEHLPDVAIDYQGRAVACQPEEQEAQGVAGQSDSVFLTPVWPCITFAEGLKPLLVSGSRRLPPGFLVCKWPRRFYTGETLPRFFVKRSLRASHGHGRWTNSTGTDNIRTCYLISGTIVGRRVGRCTRARARPCTKADLTPHETTGRQHRWHV